MALTTIGADGLSATLISGQTALTSGLVTADELIVSDGGVIKKMAMSVWAEATETFTNKSIDFGTNTLTGSVAEFNAALQSESFATLAGTETLASKTLTTPTIVSTGWTNATHAHGANNSGGTLDASVLGAGTLPAARISADSIVEGKLNVSNAPTNGEVLTARDGVAGGFTWEAAAGTAPVFGRVVRTAGNVTTTSTSFVDMTGAEITFTTGEFPVHFSVAHMTRNTTQGIDGLFNVELDGSTLMFGTDGIGYAQAVAGLNSLVGFSGQTAVLSAGSHTLKEQWRVAANTGTIPAASDNSAMFSAFEIR